MNHESMLPDEALMAYLDGEATAETTAALAADPARYADRLAALRDADRRLTDGLRALQPPDDLALGEWLLGRTDRATQRALQAFLARHPHAARRLALLEEFLAAVALPEPVRAAPGERVRVLLAQLLGGGSAPLAFGLRGDQEGVYSAGDYQIVLETDTDLDAPGRRVLTGLLTGPALPSAAEAHLWAIDAADALPHYAAIDAFGNFTFAGLESGRYELIVAVAAQTETIEIHVQHLQVT